MSEQDLCVKCHDYYRDKYGAGAFFRPDQHCHHEQKWKEKEECSWCKDWRAFEQGYKGMATYEIVKKLIGLNPDDPECPICDRKLNA